MKLKDYKGNLVGVKIKIPKKYQIEYTGILPEMYILSNWNKGLWLRQKMSDTRMYPLCLDKVSECLEWTIVKEKVCF